MNIIMSRALQHQYLHKPPPVLASPSSPLDFTDRIPFREIQILSETLGSGSFGTVFKGRWKNREVAVKQFKTREEIDSFLVEVKQLSCVKHPNIVTLYGASSLSDTAYLIMEYAEGGSLNHLLHECKQQEYDLRHALSWAKQTARGVAYLHGIRPKPIMHRDLKPANLLLFSRGKILKICDFGTACTVKTQMTNNTGSASYMAPEVFATSSYLESGDVFSWSIIFWEILARRHPYSQQYSNPYQILWRVKQEGTRPTELESCPKVIWKLITRSWHKDPNRRPTMREVADKMEFIYSLTEKSTYDTTNNSQQQKSPHRQLFPICSHFNDQQNNRPQHLQPQFVSFTNEGRSSISDDSQTSYAKKELKKRERALLLQLQSLQSRDEELQKLTGCDSRSTNEKSFEEYKELKKASELAKRRKELMMKKLKERQCYTLDHQCSNAKT